MTEQSALEVVDLPSGNLAPPTANGEQGIAAILDRAVQTGMSPESLEKIVALYERMADRLAAQKFTEAMGKFKAICPPIPRRTENNQFQVTRDGVRQARRYASLEDIERTIRKPLADAGLSFRWGSATIANGMLSIACIVSHGSHSEESVASIPIESKAGASDQQKYGTAMTYAQRYSLIAALGLTTCDEDTDGNAGPENYINTEQQTTIREMLKTTGADEGRFLKWLGVDAVGVIPVSRFAEAVAALMRKGGAK